MTADSVLDELFRKRPTVIKPGLSRIETALAVLGRDPLLAAPSVLIGGTNGKGSTAGFLWQLMGRLGLTPGIFSSPHLWRFEERVQVHGQTVELELLLDELEALRKDLPEDVYEPLSFFEINTILALRVFRRLGADVDLLEVGMGGRWDSTNVASPRLSIITSIGLDHQQYLGDTTAKIAFEKAGIMRGGLPVLTAGVAGGDAEALATLRHEAAAKGALLFELGRDFLADEDAVVVRFPGRPEESVAWPNKSRCWPPFLKQNFTMAVAALAWLLDDDVIRQRLPDGPLPTRSLLEVAVRGLDSPDLATPPSLRGRFEELGVTRESGVEARLLFDVCHNVDGAVALRRALEAPGSMAAVPAYIAILADKDCNGILDVLRPALGKVRLFAVASERSWTRAALLPRHQDLAFFPDFQAAWRDASDAEAGGAAFNVVCGSVYAVGEVMAGLGLLR